MSCASLLCETRLRATIRVMEKADLMQHLELAERHFAEGEQLLARQRAKLEELRRDGHNSAEAELLLQTLEESQALHVYGRDRLRREVEELVRSSANVS